MAIKVESTVFEEGEPIPKRYTCDDVDLSPPLKMNNLPESTKSLAVICEDPDAPSGIWTHWVIFNIPPENNTLPEGLVK